MPGIEQGTFKSIFSSNMDDGLVDHGTRLAFERGVGSGEEGEKGQEGMERTLKFPTLPMAKPRKRRIILYHFGGVECF